MSQSGAPTGGSDIVAPTDLGELPADPKLRTQLAELGQGQYRVGRYFEDLVAFWLREIRCVEILALGEQVRDGNRTVGELDCLFRDESGVVTHWELAVKFYLHHVDADRPSDFPGPNATDNFEKKTARLFDHQLPLSITARPEVELRQALVRGCIFRHHSAFELGTGGQGPGDSYELPDRMAADGERGWWLRRSELDQSALFGDDGSGGHSAGSQSGAAIMTKPHWLGHPGAHTSTAQIRTEIHDHFDGPAHPIMVSVALADGLLQRVVVVDEQWPAAK